MVTFLKLAPAALNEKHIKNHYRVFLNLLCASNSTGLQWSRICAFRYLDCESLHSKYFIMLLLGL